MNSMYDILNKMKLLEGRGSKPDFLDIDKDGDRKEPMKKAAKEVDESVEEGSTGDYSAKKARAGKDIGKPGKQFAKIAKSAAERYGSKERGEKVAGAVLAKLRKEDVDVEEGNDFTKARLDAIRAGRPTFKVDGKTYRVTGDTSDERQQVDELSPGTVRSYAGKAIGDRHKSNTRRIRAVQMAHGGDDSDQAHADEIWDKETRNINKRTAGLERAAARLTKEGQLDEREYGQRDDFDKYGRPGDTIRTTKGTLTKTATGVKHERRPEDEEDTDADRDDSAPKKRGRPAGSKRALGAKGPTGKSKLLKKGAIRESDSEIEISGSDKMSDEERHRAIMKKYPGAKRTGKTPGEYTLPDGTKLVSGIRGVRKVEEDQDLEADAGEYGREGDMAKEQLHTIEAAAEELASILGDEQDLPEWAQKKVTLAMDYIDTARDYMLAQGGEEPVAEVAPPGAKAERMVKHIKKAYAKDGKLTDREKSIAYATAWKAKKAGKVEEVDTGEADARKTVTSSKEEQDKVFAKHRARAEKEKQDHEKSKKEKSVEETTTAGSVATAPAAAPKGKKGMVFGKGVYEGQIAESFNKKLDTVLTEGMNINMSMDAEGHKSLSVSATDEDAVKLAQILRLAGMDTAHDYHEACPGCGQEPCGCEQELEEADLANSPDEQYADTDTMVNTLSGGLNGRKSTGQSTLPVVNRNPRRTIGDEMASIREETEQRLANLYQKYKG